MNNLKTYKDSKEFPLVNFERIETTSNFLYMVKGYEDGDDIKADEKQMKELFNAVVQDYVVSLNIRNNEIIQHGKINANKIDLMKFFLAKEIIILQIKANKLGGSENENIKDLLSVLRIQRKDNLIDQILVIDNKIEKIKNDIAEAESKIKKNNPEQNQESDINEMITNVELILERSIDMEKTSLYRFGIMQSQAKKKIEQMNKSK